MGNSRFVKMIDRKLPERSRLMFYFPKIGDSTRYTRVELPFFENIDISEQKKARYKTYSLISRSSNLYSYMGADSRKFTLNFNLTIPHMLEEHPEIQLKKDYINTVNLDNNVQTEKDKFLNFGLAVFKTNQLEKLTNGLVGLSNRMGNDYLLNQAQESAKQVLQRYYDVYGLGFQERISLERRYGLTFTLDAIKEAEQKEKSLLNYKKGVQEDYLAAANTTLNSPGASKADKDFAKESVKLAENNINNYEDSIQAQQDKINEISKTIEKQQAGGYNFNSLDMIIDQTLYWINIIRSSVSNNTQNPLYGPPVIRINHGIMYQNVPCICTDYSLKFNEAAGYDIDTLMPLQTQVTMQLEELRTGDFGDFDPQGTPIQRDNLAGWEAVISQGGSMDPGYSKFIK